MTDYQAARQHMVESQINTMGVVNQTVLDAFLTLRREDFVPVSLRPVAYTDDDIALGHGRVLMEPLLQARMIQALDITPGDRVLDLGCATGYSSAILAGMASSVVAVEPSAEFLAEAEKNWTRLGAANIMPHNGSISDGYAASSPYQAILINGAVASVPDKILAMLDVGGRLVCVVKTDVDSVGCVTIFTKNDQGHVGQRVLHESGVPYLPGMEPVKKFDF